MRFFDIIYKDESQYDGHIIIKRKSKDNMRTVKSSPRSKCLETIAAIRTYKSYDYYITANTFTTGDINAPLLAFNNIVIDVDGHAEPHGVPPNDEIKDFVWRLQKSPDVPQPTATVYTGRGIQLWYHFEQVSAKCYILYTTTCEMLITALQSILDDNNYTSLEVDTIASKRHTGLFRMPNTVNTKTHTQVTYELNETAYTLHGLNELLSEYAPKRTTTRNNPPIKRIDCNYLNLHKARMNVLQSLAERQKQAGKRNTILWLTYNTLVQLKNTEQARHDLKQINQKFYEPLRTSEVNAIMRSIDNNPENYEVTKKTFMELLDISEQYYVEHSNPRTAERKRKAETKQARRERIKADLLNGMTQRSVSDKYKVSIATVKRISAELKKAAIENKIAM